MKSADTHVFSIKDQGLRCTLGTTPKGRTTARFRILGEIVQQLLDIVVKVFLKLEAGPMNTFIKANWLFSHKE